MNKKGRIHSLIQGLDSHWEQRFRQGPNIPGGDIQGQTAVRVNNTEHQESLEGKKICNNKLMMSLFLLSFRGPATVT